MTKKNMLIEMFGYEVKTRATKELVSKVYDEYKKIMRNNEIVKSVNGWKEYVKYFILNEK